MIGKENNMPAEIIFVFIVMSGEKIAPSMGMDMAKKDNNKILF